MKPLLRKRVIEHRTRMPRSLVIEKVKRTVPPRAIISLLLVMLALTVAGHGQEGTLFWSQVDTYVGLTPSTNVMFLAAGTPGVDGKHPTLVLGPNFDIAVLPFLTNIKSNNPERGKYLTFRIGYRYVRALDTSKVQNNGVLEMTPRIPLPAGLQIADRNRIDLRGLPDRFTWRYRNRLTLSRTFDIHHFSLTPYGEAEVFYDCETGEWTQYSYTFGAFSRLTRKVEVEAWFRRRTTIVEPITTVNIVGVKLSLFFRNFSK
jgi:hypothetical protein